MNNDRLARIRDAARRMEAGDFHVNLPNGDDEVVLALQYVTEAYPVEYVTDAGTGNGFGGGGAEA